MSYNDENPVTNGAAADRSGPDAFPGDAPDHAPRPLREPRHDGWTVERQHAFLDDLGHHGNVTRAAGAVGLSASSAYRLRGRDAALAAGGGGGGAFAAGWRAATAMAYTRLRDLAFERIENGTVQTVFYQGKFAGTRLVFSDRLLLGMLAHLRPEPVAGSVEPDPADAYAAAMDAFAVAVETGTDPVMPMPDPAPPAAADAPSPGEGPVHDARAAAAQARFARGADPYVPRFPGRIYPPFPDDVSLAAYPDGLSADDLAHEDAAELAAVGLSADGTPCDAATRAAAQAVLSPA